jgi:hypothetical protein
MKKELFSGTFFLIISILVTAGAAVGIMDGAPNVFTILASVSVWLAYGSSKAGEEWVRGLGLGRGTVKAMFIVNWVFVGIFSVCGVAVMFFYRAISALFFAGLYSGGSIGSAIREYGSGLSELFGFFQKTGNMAFVWCGLLLLLAAAVTAVINILFFRNLITFCRSLCESNVSEGMHVDKAECVKGWLFVLGILTCIGVLGFPRDGMAAFVSGCSGAAMITASRWIKYCVIPASVEEAVQPQSEWYSAEQ